MASDCLVCREHTLDVPVPGGHLVADDHVVAFHLPPWPPPSDDVFLGYLMVTSRRHVPGFAQLEADEAASVGRTVRLLSKALEDLGAEKVYVLVVGHGVPHLHVHLIPRWPGTPADVSWQHVDDWGGARRGDAAAAAQVADRVRAALDGPGVRR